MLTLTDIMYELCMIMWKVFKKWYYYINIFGIYDLA